MAPEYIWNQAAQSPSLLLYCTCCLSYQPPCPRPFAYPLGLEMLVCHFYLTSQDLLSPQKHLFSFLFLIKTRSYVSSQAGLELTMYWGMALNFWPACFQLLSARITVIHHHIQFRWCWVTEPGPPACWAINFLYQLCHRVITPTPPWHTWNQFNFMWICIILLFFSPLNCRLSEGRRH